MTTSIYQSAKGTKGQVSFEIPSNAGTTRSPKKSVATISYSLQIGKSRYIAGSCAFTTIEGANAAYELNSKNPHIICGKVNVK